MERLSSGEFVRADMTNVDGSARCLRTFTQEPIVRGQLWIVIGDEHQCRTLRNFRSE
jgi:hypothetical protein